MEQDAKGKIEETRKFMLMLWTVFLIILYACSFLREYYFPIQEEIVTAGEKALIDLQKLFFFALMGMGFLIDIVNMRDDRNKAFVFLLLSLVVGGFSGGIGAMQCQVLSQIMGGG